MTEDRKPKVLILNERNMKWIGDPPDGLICFIDIFNAKRYITHSANWSELKAIEVGTRNIIKGIRNEPRIKRVVIVESVGPRREKGKKRFRRIDRWEVKREGFLRFAETYKWDEISEQEVLAFLNKYF